MKSGIHRLSFPQALEAKQGLEMFLESLAEQEQKGSWSCLERTGTNDFSVKCFGFIQTEKISHPSSSYSLLPRKDTWETIFRFSFAPILCIPVLPFFWPGFTDFGVGVRREGTQGHLKNLLGREIRVWPQMWWHLSNIHQTHKCGRESMQSQERQRLI